MYPEGLFPLAFDPRKGRLEHLETRPLHTLYASSCLLAPCYATEMRRVS